MTTPEETPPELPKKRQRSEAWHQRRPAWAANMSQPQFLTLCGLLPFLLVSILHLLYASRCWRAYTQRGAWVGMLALNVLVLVPYANALAFPALLVWLLVLYSARCPGARARARACARARAR